MESKLYKRYRVCKSCGESIPLNPKFYKRNLRDGHYMFHLTCIACEDKLRNMPEWKDGLLLCHRCHTYKPEELFTPNNTTNAERHFRRHICNSCSTERQREHDMELEASEKLRKCLRFRLLGAKDRALKAGIPFNLTLEFLEELWIKQEGKCALSGLPMTFELKLGRIPTNVSIDKKNRLLGYTQDNVQLVCMAANQAKSDMSEEELYNLCKSIVKTYEDKNNFSS